LREDFKEGLWAQDRLFVRKSSLSAIIKGKKRDKKPYFYFVFNDVMLKTTTTLESDAKSRAIIAKKGRTYKYVQTIRFCNVTLDTDGRQVFPDGLSVFQIIEETPSERKDKKHKDISQKKKKNKKNSPAMELKKTKSSSKITMTTGKPLTKVKPQGKIHVILCDSDEEEMWIKDIELAIAANKVRARLSFSADVKGSSRGK
jgi:hypothetical protein